jgi:hypothetical protein
MASKKTLNTQNLERLGARRLAELLMEISQGDGAAKRRLRLELAGAAGADDVAREVRKRLSTIERSRSFVDWQQRQALVKDLETQRQAIVEQVAKEDPATALDLMWRFLGLAHSVFERCDDSNGSVARVFQSACNDVANLAEAANADPEELAECAFNTLTDNGYGEVDDLIPLLAPHLGAGGLAHLKARMEAWAAETPERPAEEDRQVIGYGSSGPIYADDIDRRRREMAARQALQQIADAQGDVESFIAQYSDAARRAPQIAAAIGERLVAAGRPADALAYLDAVDTKRAAWLPVEWEEVRANALVELGRPEEAQRFRWACFERTLSKPHLRAYLKRLPEFDDVEAEERALDVAQRHNGFNRALAFLIDWPALGRAAQLVVDRADEVDGDHYEVLTPAADALQEKHPLAATVLRRAMIDFALDQARVKRYRHAARHFWQCASAATMISDFGRFETHDAFDRRLKSKHARKRAFWDLVRDQ